MKWLTTWALLAVVTCAHAQTQVTASATTTARKFLGCAYSPAQAPEFATYWDAVTPENAGKWGRVEARRGQMDWQASDAAYQFAKAHGFAFQWHVLLWGQQQPLWLRHRTPAEQRHDIQQWFAAVAAHYPDLDLLQVVNEPLNTPPSGGRPDSGHYLQALGGRGASGEDWIIHAYELARKTFPHARLMINEYNVTRSNRNTRRYLAIIRALQRRHLIDAIGVQEHAFETTPDVPMAVHQANLDRLAATGLPIYVTELDVDGPSDASQLRAYQRIFPVFWNHPAVRGITLWGFRPGLWRDKQGANLVRADGSERPALEWLERYVKEQHD